MLYSRVRLRIHILKKDLARRKQLAETGQSVSSETNLPQNRDASEKFWELWRAAEARNWVDFTQWTATDFLASTGTLSEPKTETAKQRVERKKRRMADDPEYAATQRKKELDKRRARKSKQQENKTAIAKTAASKSAPAAAPSQKREHGGIYDPQMPELQPPTGIRSDKDLTNWCTFSAPATLPRGNKIPAAARTSSDARARETELSGAVEGSAGGRNPGASSSSSSWMNQPVADPARPAEDEDEDDQPATGDDEGDDIVLSDDSEGYMDNSLHIGHTLAEALNLKMSADNALQKSVDERSEAEDAPPWTIDSYVEEVQEARKEKDAVLGVPVMAVVPVEAIVNQKPSPQEVKETSEVQIDGTIHWESS